ncbi:polygalacturonase-like [Olea europaea subsp. europaea]|uniref:Polygalacturonase-like n=1 Tax=Olea europaea subsp. europaea TaxID=158383 RepID=A0A8S0SQP4_OLEEU|nr:polygalacturonase-like [Olea europaea subsp. europaea]
MASLVSFLAFHFLFTIFQYSSLAANVNYNVQTLGAKPDGKTDSIKAFLSAWTSACASGQPATIYVPPGRFLLGTATFAGQSCKNQAITIQIDGTLVAPSNYKVIGNSGTWINFESVTGVSVIGGTLDAQGANLWACKNSGKSCPTGATTLAFYNSKNIMISGLSSINSQMFHILVYGSQNAKLVGMKVSAPGNSPNTDGIHVEKSSSVTIMNSKIGTGDDCISIGPGTSNLWIENVACGPGHGISIGSLGWQIQEPGVQNVTVKSATFTGTQNGVRVKTWARPSKGFVKYVLFQHLVMVNVENPIIIDQNYCPGDQNCPDQVSGVKISDITYQDIHGSSATEIAMKFDCSTGNPCSDINLEDVKLTYKNEPAHSSCINADGKASGLPVLLHSQPPGRYFLGATSFTRHLCKNPAITLHIDGTLVAPSDYNVIGNSGNWIKFKRVTGVSVIGGILDVQGDDLWACKNSGKNCPNGATTLAFYNSNNIIINGLSSVNSQNFHILIYGCQNAKLVEMKVSAAGNSPNTDGIQVEKSIGVTLMNSKIGTGDDCVSIGPGTSNLWIENVSCGPGHGIIIGSLGWDLQEPGVQNVTVKTVTFTRTQNGPIIIDQNYCPDDHKCPDQVSSVKISDITYQDIHGSSSTEIAMKLDCSKQYPCSDITLEDVNLIYNNEPAQSSCINADGKSSGLVQPNSCLYN